ncbi:GNAT family N-acetyltransferase [Aquincola sp. S2]|uniref:GNAT family N-acetyltransferase n=1 Tax=Pseudaquabacterium terrae TaxID=2732868 RepID=A0ABX2ETB8_9BURK|nr:GNAT family N-acetyltransferase [Aquabacterium terrae]NRF71789.1 GNAT family N-acetyltransferase [Aquabacterium terrae]
MSGRITIEPLAQRPDLLATIEAWFESEWPGYYGPGGPGDARHDLQSYSRHHGLPLGLVAALDGHPCGFAALKREAFPSHPQCTPWAGAAYVQPALRRQGIGRALLLALEAPARALGHERLYCATATSDSLLLRCGWGLIERVLHEGQDIGVYDKAL